MKQFFKSKEFKSIAVLVSIALICFGLLAVLSTLLKVTPEEKTLRAIKKIYGTEKEYSVILDYDQNKEFIEYGEFGKIEKIYSVTNGNDFELLFKSTGYNGYKNGTVTLWIAVEIADNKATIKKTVLDGYEKQTLMSKLNQDYYDSFEIIDGYYSSKQFEENRNVITGATKSSNAVSNAVNCVMKYLKTDYFNK